MIFRIFEVITTFVEIYIAYCVIELLFPREHILKYKIISSIGLTIIILIINNIQLFSVFPLLIFPIYVGFTASKIYKSTFKYAFFISLFYTLIIYIIDFITVSIINIVISNFQYGYIVFNKIGLQRLIFICIAKAELILYYYLFKRYLKTRDEVEVYKSLHIITILGFLGAFFLIEETLFQFQRNVALSWIFLAVIIGLMMIVLIIYVKYNYEKNSMDILKMRKALSDKNYVELKQVYEKNSKRFHDYNNHIRVLQKLLSDKDYERLSLYIQDLSASDLNEGEKVWTGEKVIDFILNNKIAEGNKVDIDFKIVNGKPYVHRRTSQILRQLDETIMTA